MTIYEFKCDRGHVLEEDWPMDKVPQWVLCDRCGGKAPRQFSVGGIKFKGDGFNRSSR